MNNSDIVHFNTVSQMKSTGPGIYEESMMLHSAGAAASGVICGVDSLDAEGRTLPRRHTVKRLLYTLCLWLTTCRIDRLGLLIRWIWNCRIRLALRLLDRGRVPGPSALVRGVWRGLGRLPSSGK